MAPTTTPSTSIRWKIRRNASSSPSSPVAAFSRTTGIRIASACRVVWAVLTAARGVCVAATPRVPLVAPPIPYGVCTATRRYPGTVSVSVDALKAFVRDILADFVRNGVRRGMILSGHAGREHMMALRAATQEVVDQGTGLRATVLSDYDIIYASQGILPEGDGHAGAGETSRIMTARPDLVKGKSPPGKNEIPLYAVVADPRKYWSGVTGDPSKASKALGEKLDDLVIGELGRLVEELRRRA